MHILFKFLKNSSLGDVIWWLTGWVLVQETSDKDNHPVRYYWSKDY